MTSTFFRLLDLLRIVPVRFSQQPHCTEPPAPARTQQGTSGGRKILRNLRNAGPISVTESDDASQTNVAADAVAARSWREWPRLPADQAPGLLCASSQSSCSLTLGCTKWAQVASSRRASLWQLSSLGRSDPRPRRADGQVEDSCAEDDQKALTLERKCILRRSGWGRKTRC